MHGDLTSALVTATACSTKTFLLKMCFHYNDRSNPPEESIFCEYNVVHVKLRLYEQIQCCRHTSLSSIMMSRSEDGDPWTHPLLQSR